MNELEISLDPNHLEILTQSILREAKASGATEAAVHIATNKGFTVNAHDGDVETVEYHQDKDIEILVYFGKRMGVASISDMREPAIKAAVAAACHIAKFTDEDPAAGLAEIEELAFNFPKLELAFPSGLSVEKAIELACACEREAIACDKRIMSAEAATVATSESLNVYANSQGFVGSYPYTNHEISCILVAKEGEEMQRDFSYSMASDFNKLASISEIAQEAAHRTVKRLGARQIPTCRSPVIFVAEEARGLMGHFASAISGGSIYRKSSFLLDAVGKKIFPEFMHIQEFPHLAKALGSVPFDSDGVATRNNIFVEDGRLLSYYLGVYSARKLGLKTTGNAGGTHNLTVRPSNINFTDLVKQMHKGLIITEMMGQGVNAITGDYSRGASGFWVENGEIQYPVHEITVAGNLLDIYLNIAAISNDQDERGNIRTGSILINEITIAGS